MQSRNPSLPKDRPHSLGAFLRACRARLQPDALGLPGGNRRRRTPGLRREEVATLTGISTTWYTWIEQGRTTAVSDRTLDALADGLRLSRAERTYLFELAARTDPAGLRADPGGWQLATLQPLVDAVRAPAYLLDRYWHAVAWNRAAAALFQAWLGRTGAAPRNLLRYVFTDPDAPTLIADWPQRARRLVAEYRADTAAWQDDPDRTALVEALCQASADFAQAWREQRVQGREGGLRTFQHPRLGRCTYRQHTLRVAEHPELKLIMLLPQPADLADTPHTAYPRKL